MSIRKIGKSVWLNEYPFGEIQGVDTYLERTFPADSPANSTISRASVRLRGGHESDILVGMEFIPNDNNMLTIRVPEN
ncbi:MAG: hypothetical protein AAFQ07_20010, partial [Chloroflexota bacterium]